MHEQVWTNQHTNSMSEFLQNELQVLLDDVPLQMQLQIFYQHGRVFPHLLGISQYLNE